MGRLAFRGAGGAATGRTNNPQGLCSELHNLSIEQYMNEEIHLPRMSGSIEDKGKKETEGGKTKIRAESKMAWLFVDDPQVHTNFKSTGKSDVDRGSNIGGIKGILRDCFLRFLTLNLKELEDKNVIGFYTSVEDVTFMLVIVNHTSTKIMPRAIDVHISEYRITDNAPDSVRSGQEFPARSL